jgi:uncharacterized protein YacL
MEIAILLLLIGVLYVQLSTTKDLGRLLRPLGKRKIILDSCALIDGRIIDLVRTGFVSDELVIPKFILSELQMLADGNDAHKRERARFGLEIAAELQEYAWAEVSVDETRFTGNTDDKLVKLAKKRKAVLCTTDYNLNKVASIEGVRVLNVNELSQQLRPTVLPGEKLDVKILQKGSNKSQGVGYLEDGTMIVVEGAANAVGTTISVVVDRMHQTVAGKMVFARAAQKAATSKPKPTPKAPTYKSLVKKPSPIRRQHI